MRPEGTSQDGIYYQTLTSKEIKYIANKAFDRIKEEAVYTHFELGVGIGGEVKAPLIGEFDAQATILTINWDSDKDEPYSTFGELILNTKALEVTKKLSLSNGIELRNILGHENVVDFDFLTVDLFEEQGLELNLSAQAGEEILNELKGVDIAFAQEGYMAIGWGYEVAYKPIIAMGIIREEINNYDGIK